jgi:hypothetical protein
VLLYLATLGLCCAVALWLGWVHGQDRAIAAAAQRAQRSATAWAEQLQAERSRTQEAQAVARIATRHAAAAQRQLRLARAELRELRQAAPPLDTDTGLALAAPCNASEDSLAPL